MKSISAGDYASKRLDIQSDHFDLIPPLLERVELKPDYMQLTLKLVIGTAPAAIITTDLPHANQAPWC